MRLQDTALFVHTSRIGVIASGLSRLLTDRTTWPEKPGSTHHKNAPHLGQNTLSMMSPLSAGYVYVEVSPDKTLKLEEGALIYR